MIKGIKIPVVCIVIMAICIVVACTKPYTPTVSSSTASLLVVEGLINTGTDSTIIKLSHTASVNNKTIASPETKAAVTVEDAQGNTYPLPETTVKGTYASPALGLSSAKQYRVRIKTTTGKTYLSDLVVSKAAPPIDSVGYTVKDNGVQIYVNAHDPANNTHYYLYTFRETWQFNARFPSSYVSNGAGLVTRTTAQQIFYCYGTDTTTNIITTSTLLLSQDVVSQLPITFIDATSEKIETKYSILVAQVALTKDAYDFWTKLQKNTEQLGSIFDAQPSQITGNVHNIADATEPVVGYIGAGSLQKKRLYITRATLPASWQATYPYECNIDTALINPPPNPPAPTYLKVQTTLIDLPAKALAITPITNMYGPGWAFTSYPCADCTIRGVTKAPAFWK